MPNVLMTQRCVRSCPYCFAKTHMSDAPPDDVMSWENLIYIADLFLASGEHHFPLLGGEPALHPHFNDMVLYLLERGFDVTVFTSGIFPEGRLLEAAEVFAPVPANRLSFICNLNDPAKTPAKPGELDRVKRFLSLFGERVVPGFNIYREDFDLDFLFHYISQYGLVRNIRLGLTHPIVGRKNKYIAPGRIPAIIDRLFSYTPLFERLRIQPGLDCGFPLCHFSAGQLAWLYRQTNNRYDFGCGPVVDIAPDMTLWPCFPLSSFHKRSLFEFNHLGEIFDAYNDLHAKIKVEAGGIYAACDSCAYRDEGRCAGGCVAHNINQFGNEHPLRMKEVYP